MYLTYKMIVLNFIYILCMKFNPGIHRRKSIRLKGYDYSQAGMYFITICCQNKECLFGEIFNYEILLNDAGHMINKWYAELENKFPDIKCNIHIIMPNHFHCILINSGIGNPETESVGADLRVCPPQVEHTGSQVEHTGSPLHRVVQWFKTMTTNDYIRGVKNFGWKRFNGKLWQRNYYEHIIRNAHSYEKIYNYITSNPSKWQEDKLYKS